jgi:two-component system OmpR family sensor kinase
MRSLRFRLTLAFMIVIGLVIVIAAMAIMQVATQLIARSSLEAVAESIAATRTIVAERPHERGAVLLARILREAERPGATMIAVPEGNVENSPPAREIYRYLPPDIFRLSGLAPKVVDVPGGTVLIAPDLRRIMPRMTPILGYLSVAVVLALLGAFLFTRWITAQALDPLVLVTSELERFGGGDFSPRSLDTSDREELGRLTHAFNRTVAQVTAAFKERERADAELRALLADAGHALRTPLTVVGGFVDILDSPAFEDLGIRSRALHSMRVETQRMHALVKGLLSLARLEYAENRRPLRVGVVRAAELAVEQVRNAGGAEIAIDGTQTAQIVADPAELHQAIVNLIENAVKYGAGQPVVVTVADEQSDVVVRVHNRGPGIRHTDRAHIFDRFYRGENTQDIAGSGLGLSIAARAAERNAGSLVLERADRDDTVFALRFPRTDADERPPTSS